MHKHHREILLDGPQFLSQFGDRICTVGLCGDVEVEFTSPSQPFSVKCKESAAAREKGTSGNS
jgi:hypothetical protein